MRTVAILAAALALSVSAAVWAKPPPPAQIVTEIRQTQGRTLIDLNGDGVFDGQGGLDVSAYVISCSNDDTGTRRVWRAVLEFDVSAFLSRKARSKIVSAKLVVQTNSSRNMRVQNPDGTFAPANWVVNGYAGDGIATLADALQTNPLVSDLSAPPYSFIEIDVTDFLKFLLGSGEGFAGFMLQVPGDYLQDNYQDSWILAKDEPANSAIGPRLVIVQSGGRR